MDDALDAIKKNFEGLAESKRKGVERVIFLDSEVMGAAVKFPPDKLKRHFKDILRDWDDDIVHLVSPVFANSHFFFAAIHITGKERLIVHSVGARGENTPLQAYVPKLIEYLHIPDNKIESPRARLGLRTTAGGANACAGYALAALEEYLASGGKLSNREKVHEKAATWMVWLRKRDKEMKYLPEK